MGLFETGIRGAVDKWLLDKAAEKRDYGDYWSASSAGYCMRKNIFDRLKVPHTSEDARKQRVFTAGDIFHQWMQEITKANGLSIAQELGLQDEELMIRGHIDDLVLVKEWGETDCGGVAPGCDPVGGCSGHPVEKAQHLILYDYKTQNSRAFSYKRDEMSHYHRMQLATYMYMLRRGVWSKTSITEAGSMVKDLTEARILKISKDDLRMSEEQLMWTPDLEKEVVGYWKTLNGYWEAKKIPKCTCEDYEGGFLAKEKWNSYFYEGEPCSIKWLAKCKQEGTVSW